MDFINHGRHNRENNDKPDNPSNDPPKMVKVLHFVM